MQALFMAHVWSENLCISRRIYTDRILNLSNSNANASSAAIMEHIKTEAAGQVDIPPPPKVAAASAASAAAAEGVVYLAQVKDGIRDLFSKYRH